MMIETPEFAHEAVSNDIAGAPGSATEKVVEEAAHNMDTESGAAPCEDDMNDDAESAMRPEELSTPAVREGTFKANPTTSIQHEQELRQIQKTKTFEFHCDASTSVPQVFPAILDEFDVGNAFYEGNDRNGKAHDSEIEVTSCGCVCSGINTACGEMGSVSYYAEVNTRNECAQMICHNNLFAICKWRNDTVSSGVWSANNLAFNSNSLTLAPIPSPVAIPVPVAPTSTVRQNSTSTKNVSNSSSSSLVSPLTPSPSPSASFLFDEGMHKLHVDIKVMNFLGSMMPKLCIDLSVGGTNELSSLLSTMEIPSGPVVPSCPPDLPPPATPTPKPQSDEYSKQELATLANALAGYNGNSPLIGDVTRHTSRAMDANQRPSTGMDESMLIALREIPSITTDAIYKLQLLLTKLVPSRQLCDPNMPSFDKFFAQANALPKKTCSSKDQATDADGFVMKTFMATKVALNLATPEESDEITTKTLTAPLRVRADDDDDNAETSVVDESMRIAPSVNFDKVLPIIASDNPIVDSQGRQPGARAPVPVPGHSSVSLPQFGEADVEAVWSVPKNAAPVMEKPSLMQEEEDGK